MAHILLVEDDIELSGMLKQWLAAEGYEVDFTADGAEALELLRTRTYDGIILDWGLPGVLGIDILKTYRSHGGNAPVLFLTGQAGINYKETGLDSGADDYVTKPFSGRELSARLRALLRRPPAQLGNTLKVADLVLDREGHKVFRDGKEVQLMPREFALLEFLMRHAGQVFSADALLQSVWPTDSQMTSEALRTYIMRLRQKIEANGAPSLIETIPRVGYCLRAPE